MARLSPDEIYQVARLAGFPPATAVKMVAIALKESGGDPRALNAKPPDESYGLWQINMLGTLGTARLREYGLSSKEQLYDPAVNARAAYRLWAGSDSNLDRHWAIVRSELNRTRYERYLPIAQAAAERVEVAAAVPAPAPAPDTVADLSPPAGPTRPPATKPRSFPPAAKKV